MIFIFSDPRTKDWFLMFGSPVPVWIISVVYVAMVTYVGPKFMENRKPYSLHTFMLFYNFGVVLLSFYIFTEVIVLQFYIKENSVKTIPSGHKTLKQRRINVDATIWRWDDVVSMLCSHWARPRQMYSHILITKYRSGLNISLFSRRLEMRSVHS